MSIMDTFRSAFGGNSQQPQQPQVNQPGNLPAQQPVMMSQGSPDGQIPGGQAIPQEQEKSPFAEFEKMWDPKVPVNGEVLDGPIKFQIDPGKVQQSARNIDFTKQITPALLAQIKAGGEGATDAMLQAMNEMAQTVFAQTMMANTKVLESGLESSHQRSQKTLPDQIRKQNIGATLREDNPLFSNPATAPMLQMLESQLTSQFPNATGAEISAHARKYLSTFAGEITKSDPQVVSKTKFAAGRELDWSNVPI